MSFVYPIAELLPDGLVAALRDELSGQGAPWVDGGRTAGRDRSKKRNQELDPDCGLRQQLSTRIGEHLARRDAKGAWAFSTLADPRRLADFMFSRTGVGGGYADHMDNNYMNRGRPDELRSDLSMTVFLSEPDSYDGGELVIDSDMPFAPSFKMPAGGAVLYATTSVHRVNPVMAGERLAAITWVQSRISDPFLRQMNADRLEVLNLLSRDGVCTPQARPYLITKLEKVRGNLVKRAGG